MQIDDFLVIATDGQVWYQAARKLRLHSPSDKLFKRSGIELMACNFTLTRPKFTIHIEDSITKSFIEDRLETDAFDIVREVRAEKMVKVGRVGSTNTMGEA